MKMKGLFAIAIMTIMISSASAFDSKTILPRHGIPDTYEQTLEFIGYGPNPNRYLMWTFDGVNVMWGVYGNGYFVGNDNNGNIAWGIYGSDPVIQKSRTISRYTTFSGYYKEKGNLFEGNFKGSTWDAKNLFNRRVSSGRFITFKPKPMPEPNPIVISV